MNNKNAEVQYKLKFYIWIITIKNVLDNLFIINFTIKW